MDDKDKSTPELLDVIADLRAKVSILEVAPPEEVYRLTLTTISDAVFVTDSDGIFTFICPNVHVIFGYSVEEVAAFGKIVNLLGNDIFNSAELHEVGELSNIERKILDKASQEHYLLVTVKHIAIGTGTILYTCRDVTERKMVEDALHRSQVMLQAAFDNMQYAINVSLKGMQVMANSAALQLFGFSSYEEARGIPIITTIAPDERPRVIEYARLRSVGLPYPTAYQTRGLRKDGSEFDMDVKLSTYEIDGEVFTLRVIRDITEERRIQHAEHEQRMLAEALTKTAEILNRTPNSQDLFEQVLDLVGQIVPHDGAAVVLLQNDIMKVVSSRNLSPEMMTLSDTNHFRLRDGTAIKTLITSKQPVIVNIPRDTGDFFYEMPGFDSPHTRIGVPILVQEDLVGFLLLLKRQINFYKPQHAIWLTAFANQVSIAYHNQTLFEQQRQLTQQLVLTQESERRRVAHDLHDDAGQSLTALRMRLTILRNESSDELLKEKMNEILTLTQKTADTIRAVSYGLRPPLIDTLGLNAALAALCRDFGKDTQLDIQYTGQELSNLIETANISLYRILQESLTNSARHAQATKVDVTLSERDSEVVLEIVDNGQGFDVMRSTSQTDHRGLGILGMRERAELLNGIFDIKSQPGEGTHLLITIPKG